MLNIKGDIWTNIWGGYPDIPNMSSTLETTSVLVLRFVKDEHTFSIIVFMKDKLQNQLNQHLYTIMCMFVQRVNFTYKMPLHIGKVKRSKLVVPFKNSCSFHVCVLNPRSWCFRFLIRTSMIIRKMSIISSWSLLTFGCRVWHFELSRAKSNIKLGFDS
jgi:hypothetical protein